MEDDVKSNVLLALRSFNGKNPECLKCKYTELESNDDFWECPTCGWVILKRATAIIKFAEIGAPVKGGEFQEKYTGPKTIHKVFVAKRMGVFHRILKKHHDKKYFMNQFRDVNLKHAAEYELMARSHREIANRVEKIMEAK